MTSIQVLGYAEAHPCTYLLDASYPRSMVSPAFLFENSLHAHLEVGGVHSARLTISVPSQGGYYSSSEFLLLLSPTRKADIILGADWLRCCRVSAASNVLLSPYEGVSVALPEGHVWLADDTFIPFSLLHSREDQRLFSPARATSGGEFPPPTYPRFKTTSGVRGNPHAMPGHHDQVVLDPNCSQLLSHPSSSISEDSVKDHDHPEYNMKKRDNPEYNMKNRDPPEYNMNLVLTLLKSCLHENGVEFWATTQCQHQFSVALTSVEALRSGFIRHIFDGDCVLHKGAECAQVVSCERWPHSMGIRLIDNTIQWVQEGALNGTELARLCEALGISSEAKQRLRSLSSKLVERRRKLLDMSDAAALKVVDLFARLGCQSAAKPLRAICDAHGIEVSEEASKEDNTAKILAHITEGRCVDSGRERPGCVNVQGDPTMNAQRVVYLQVAVLQHVLEVASRKQLQVVLDLHEIAYDTAETVKKLRGKLKRYISTIERGKVKEAKAEDAVIERLRRLDGIRKSWPKLVPMEMKEKLVREFRAATSSEALATFVCACCGCQQPIQERVRKSLEEVNLKLLKGPSSHWNDASFPPPPTPFSVGPLKDVLVDERGVTGAGEAACLDLCNSCSQCLRKNSLPKHALANKLYVGPVPPELDGLTMVEESMIARARAKSWIVKLQENNAEATSPTSQRGLKGHTIIYPQQPDKLATLLPPPVGETLTFICIIFVGSSQLTGEWLREKAKPLIVRREKVRNALRWLKDNNPLYQHVKISDANVNSLPVHDVLPYHVECVPSDDAQESLTSGYDNASERVSTPSSTHFETVVVADVDVHTPARQLQAAAVHHAKTNGKPFVQVAHGPSPVNEFNNVDLFPTLYPTLFPYGCGGFDDRTRSKAISMKEQAKYFFSLGDKRFQKHHSFLFIVFNILQRRALLLGSALKVKRASFAQFARTFSSVSSAAVSTVLERIEKGEGAVAHTDEERKVLRLMKEVNLVAAKVPGSSASRVAMRNEIRALTITHGMPSFYLTINPADTHNPIVKFLAGAEIDLDNMMQHDIPNYWEQSLLISSNPVIGAKFFNIYLRAFIRTVLGYDKNAVNNNGGILGMVKAHYGCVEAQGRGSLHCHMLVWIEGALNPNEIRDKVLSDPNWGKQLLKYLDDTITNVVPEDPLPQQSTPWDEIDPCTLRGADLRNTDVAERLALRMKDVHRLAARVQRHRHNFTCYKHYRPGETRSCRFDLKEENYRKNSCIDPDTGLICLRCLDGLVNNFNMTILEAVRCNMDIQFIGSGESAKAMIYYITDYITKSQLKTHVAYAALQLAVKKCEDVVSEDDDFAIKSKRLLQKCAYALISHQEMSAQQVASYLMGYEDHFTSHNFGNLYWASFERFVERNDHEKLFRKPSVEAMDSQPGREDGDADGEPVDLAAMPTDEIDHSAASEAEDDDEEVGIRVDEAGNVTQLSDQVADYHFRPIEQNAMCLWDFVAKTEKSYQRAKKASTLEDDEDNAADDGVPVEHDADGSAEAVNVDAQDMGPPKRGRRRVPNYEFLPGHSESETKHIRVRSEEVVPVPIGPAMPRRDVPDAYARYCRLIVILFKPWRTIAGLRSEGSSWETTFNTLFDAMDDHHRAVLENMHVLNECRDSRNDHMQTRSRQRSRGDVDSRTTKDVGDNGIEDVTMGDFIDHLDDIDRMSSCKLLESARDAQQCVDELTKAGFFAMIQNDGLARSEQQEMPTAEENDDLVEDLWRDTYDRRKAEWKHQASQSEEPVVAGSTSITDAAMIEQLSVAPPVISEMTAVGVANDSVTPETLLRRVGDTWTLNKEQRRAFDIVAKHTVVEKPEQLFMYLGGAGGTGKSRVVNALRDFFGLRKQTRRFRLAAFTGVAARNIGGSTLHALLQMNESGRERSTKGIRDLGAMWDGVDYLFVDEVSMIGCEMLHNISYALTEAKGNTKPFGGVNVILAGDFAQLPPIGDARLYANINTTSPVSAATNRAQSKTLGKLLWLSFQTVVILEETMRQSGTENAQFVELLGRLRNGVCTIADYDLLATRSIRLHGQPTDPAYWRFAPLIVTNNASRDVINRRCAQAFAEQHGADLHWYHAVDTHQKKVIVDESLIQRLEEQNSGQTKHRLRRIPLAIGMPVAINQNFDVAAGVVNGSHGILKRIRYYTNDQGLRILKSCVVEISGSDSDVAMPGLAPHNFPILPDVVDLRFENPASHKRCTIKRLQVPIEPGFAMTVHKAQGRTMDRVIIDLAGCRGTEPPYVMVSRATSLNAIKVLRDFDFKQITKRRSEDLRNEFRRLTTLKWKTMAQHGGAPDIGDASRTVAEHRATTVCGARKRKSPEADGTRGKRSKVGNTSR